MRNWEEADGRQNISMVIAMRIKMQGFLVFDYAKEYPAAIAQLAQWLAEGKLQRKETIVKGGLKAAEQALVDLYNGINTGMSRCGDSRKKS
jgi:NADPH-dependent curcumin reductase CurA